MRIAITAGHNAYINGFFDSGAIKYPHTEADRVKETVKELIPLLRKQGHTVMDCTPYNQHFKTRRDSHVERCRRVDAFDADIYLDIHLNAGGGEGVEVWVHNMNSKSVPFAKKISNNISSMVGIPNRGVKVNPSFWSLSLTTTPAMIIEGAFIDNKSDMDKLTPIKYAQNIAKAFGNVESTVYTPEQVKVNFRGEYKELEGFKKDDVNYIKIGYDYIPLRIVFESLGFKVTWDNKLKLIIIN